MSNSYKGKIVAIEGIQSIQRQGKEPFEKRRLMLDATRFDGLTGERGYEKRIIFEFSGKNVHVPDGFNVGDIKRDGWMPNSKWACVPTRYAERMPNAILHQKDSKNR